MKKPAMTYHHTDKRYADKIGFNNVLGETSQHFMETSNTKSWKSLIDFQDFVFEYQWFCHGWLRCFLCKIDCLLLRQR